MNAPLGIRIGYQIYRAPWWMSFHRLYVIHDIAVFYLWATHVCASLELETHRGSPGSGQLQATQSASNTLIICIPFPDGDCKSINLVVSNQIYYFRFKIWQRVPVAPYFIFSGPFLLINFSKKLPFLSKGKVLFKYGNLELYWLHSEWWNILLR